MRTASAAQLIDLKARDRKELVRVKVANAADTLVDFSSSFVSATFSADLNAVAVSGTVTFWREQATGSLAPLMNSPAPIAPGRQLTFEVAVIGTGDSVAGGDWVMLFDGLIDDVGWGGSDAQLSVPVRDLGGVLRDTWIESESLYGNDSSPVVIETVMQSLLDDTLGSAVVTLNTVGDPDFGIVLYEQQRQSLDQALGAHRDLIGWDLRYLWDDGESDFLLTFYEPDRAKSAADHTFSADDYFELNDVTQTSVGIRNVIEVRYADDVSVTAEDTTSIATFGRRYMFLDFINNNQISNEASALILATAVLGDVSQPPLTHTSENALFWPVELGDLYEFAPNEVHYSEPQTVAVVGYTHNFGPDGNTTSLQCRGAPSGGTSRWFKKGTIAKRKTEEEEEFVTKTLAESLEVLYTTKLGFSGYTIEQDDPNESLGGFVSKTLITSGVNDLFRAITDEERQDGITLYRSVGVINTNDAPVPLDWAGVRAWLGSQGEGGVTWAVALDPVGVASYTAIEQLSGQSVDEETAPPGLSFVSPDSIVHDDVLVVGTVAAGEGFVIHIRLEIEDDPDTTPQITDDIIILSDTL